MDIPIVSVNVMGGLGNQLFQISAAYAYARKENGLLQIIKKSENANRPLYWDTIFKNFHHYLVISIPSSLEQWYEDYPTMYKNIGQLQKNGKYLNGYLQTSKYFYNDDIKNEIRELLKPDHVIIDQISNKYKHLCDNSERVIVIHARRTDYVNFRDRHGPLDGNYYKNAIDIMLTNISNPIFVLSSDDNTFWNEIHNDIKEIYKHESLIMTDESEINTFILFQQFNNFIMSNSTFIWWCVWLADAKNVITPSKWFGPAGPDQYSDIFEPNWRQI